MAQINNRVSGLQILQSKHHSGLTASNHLSNYGLTEPVKAGMLMDYMFSNVNNETPLSKLLSLGKTELITNRRWRWDMMGTAERAMPVVSSAKFGNINKPLLGGEIGEIEFSEKEFALADVLAAQNGQTVRLLDDGVPTGTGYVYKMTLDSDDKDAWLAPSMLRTGSMWSKDYTKVAEGEGGGNTTYSTPMRFENCLTTLVKSASITGSAASDVMVIKVPVKMKDSDKTMYVEKWASLAEYQMLKQWYCERERALWRGKASSKKSVNGRPMYSGAGVEQQISAGVMWTVPKFTVDIIQNFLMELSYNKKSKGARKFVAFTGEYGMIEFSKALINGASQFQKIDTTFINGKGETLTFNQYTTFRGVNGTELTLMPFPMYDNNTDARSFNKHSITNRPLESYKMTILDFTTESGRPNIKKMAKIDRENVMFSVSGATSPTGTASSFGTNRSHNLDSYSIHALAEEGIHIENPFTCGQLILKA